MKSRIYLVFGDEYKVAAKSSEIVDGLVSPENRDFGLEVVDGGAQTVDAAVASIDRCMESVNTIGFLDGSKVVWLKQASFLTDNPVGKSKTVKSRLEDLTAAIRGGMPDGNALIISAPGVDKRYAFYKACKECGEILEFAAPEKAYLAEKQASETAERLFRDAGLSIGRDTLAVFMDIVGTDTRSMANEIEKLRVFIGRDGEVGLGDIHAVTCSARSAPAWDLADAFGNRDLAGALRVLRRLTSQKENAIRLIITLENRVRELMIYREALDRKWLTCGADGRGRTTATWEDLPPDVEEIFSEHLGRDPRRIHPYRIGILAGQAKRFSMRRLTECLEKAVKSHEQLVSTSLPADIVLETFLVRCIGRPQPKRVSVVSKTP